MNTQSNSRNFPLRNQVGLAGFPNQLGNLCHGAVNRQVLQAAVDDQSKQQPKDAKEDADHQQLVAVHAQKLHLGKIGELQVGFARGGLIATCGKRRWGRQRPERLRPPRTPWPIEPRRSQAPESNFA